MNRLEKIFSERRPALVIFDSCGAPTLAESEERLETIVANGADIVELGVPFSDPMADGPAIQRVHSGVGPAAPLNADVLAFAEEPVQFLLDHLPRRTSRTGSSRRR